MEIRPVRLEDANALLRIYAPYVLETTVTFEYEVPSLSEFQDRIKKITQDFPYYVAVEDHKIIGYAYAGRYKERHAYDWGCELSIYLDTAYQSKGAGKALYTQLLNQLKAMHYQVVYACIAYPNEKSVRFHERFGFKQIAYFEACGYKFNQWCDMIWMEKRIGDPHHVLPIIKLD